MKRNTKIFSVVALCLTIIASLFLTASCGKEQEIDYFFNNVDTAFTLTEDYVLSDIDVEGTEGKTNTVALSGAVVLDLNGKTLDLANYELRIVNRNSATQIVVKDGTITNGTLVLNGSNGKVLVQNVTIDESVKTNFTGVITFESSTAKDVTLDKGEFHITNEAKVNSLTVSNSATNAKVSLAEDCNVGNLNIGAKSTEVEINGSALSVSVEKSAEGTEVKASETATVADMSVEATDVVVDFDKKIEAPEVKVTEDVRDSFQGNNVTVVSEVIEQHFHHDYVLVERKTATCDIDGYEIYVCAYKGCGDTKRVPLKQSHDYREIDRVDAGRLTNGKIIYECSKCGRERHETIPAQLPISDCKSILDFVTRLIPDFNFVIALHDDTLIQLEEMFNAEIPKAELHLMCKDGNLGANLEAYVNSDTVNVATAILLKDHVVTVANDLFGDSIEEYDLNRMILDEVDMFIGNTIGGMLSSYGIDIRAEQLEDLLIALINHGETFKQLGQGITQLKFTKTEIFDANLLGIPEGTVDSFVLEETDPDTGDVIYVLNLEAANSYIESYARRTVAFFINGLLGRNTTDNVSAFIRRIPDIKIQEIVDEIVNLAEICNVDGEEFFATINDIARCFVEDFDLEDYLVDFGSMRLKRVFELANIEIDFADYADKFDEYMAWDLGIIYDKLVDLIDGLIEQDISMLKLDSIEDMISGIADEVHVAWSFDDNGDLDYFDAVVYGQILNMNRSGVENLEIHADIYDNTFDYIQEEGSLEIHADAFEQKFNYLSTHDVLSIDADILGAKLDFDSDREKTTCTFDYTYEKPVEGEDPQPAPEGFSIDFDMNFEYADVETGNATLRFTTFGNDDNVTTLDVTYDLADTGVETLDFAFSNKVTVTPDVGDPYVDEIKVIFDVTLEHDEKGTTDVNVTVMTPEDSMVYVYADMLHVKFDNEKILEISANDENPKAGGKIVEINIMDGMAVIGIDDIIYTPDGTNPDIYTYEIINPSFDIANSIFSGHISDIKFTSYDENGDETYVIGESGLYLDTIVLTAESFNYNKDIEGDRDGKVDYTLSKISFTSPMHVLYLTDIKYDSCDENDKEVYAFDELAFDFGFIPGESVVSVDAESVILSFYKETAKHDEPDDVDAWSIKVNLPEVGVLSELVVVNATSAEYVSYDEEGNTTHDIRDIELAVTLPEEEPVQQPEGDGPTSVVPGEEPTPLFTATLDEITYTEYFDGQTELKLSELGLTANIPVDVEFEIKLDVIVHEIDYTMSVDGLKTFDATDFEVLMSDVSLGGADEVKVSVDADKVLKCLDIENLALDISGMVSVSVDSASYELTDTSKTLDITPVSLSLMGGMFEINTGDLDYVELNNDERTVIASSSPVTVNVMGGLIQIVIGNTAYSNTETGYEQTVTSTIDSIKVSIKEEYIYADGFIEGETYYAYVENYLEAPEVTSETFVADTYFVKVLEDNYYLESEYEDGTTYYSYILGEYVEAPEVTSETFVADTYYSKIVTYSYQIAVEYTDSTTYYVYDSAEYVEAIGLTEKDFDRDVYYLNISDLKFVVGKFEYESLTEGDDRTVTGHIDGASFDAMGMISLKADSFDYLLDDGVSTHSISDVDLFAMGFELTIDSISYQESDSRLGKIDGVDFFLFGEDIGGFTSYELLIDSDDTVNCTMTEASVSVAGMISVGFDSFEYSNTVEDELTMSIAGFDAEIAGMVMASFDTLDLACDKDGNVSFGIQMPAIYLGPIAITTDSVEVMVGEYAEDDEVIVNVDNFELNAMAMFVVSVKDFAYSGTENTSLSISEAEIDVMTLTATVDGITYTASEEDGSYALVSDIKVANLGEMLGFELTISSIETSKDEFENTFGLSEVAFATVDGLTALSIESIDVRKAFNETAVEIKNVNVNSVSYEYTNYFDEDEKYYEFVEIYTEVALTEEEFAQGEYYVDETYKTEAEEYDADATYYESSYVEVVVTEEDFELDTYYVGDEEKELAIEYDAGATYYELVYVEVVVAEQDFEPYAYYIDETYKVYAEEYDADATYYALSYEYRYVEVDGETFSDGDYYYKSFDFNVNLDLLTLNVSEDGTELHAENFLVCEPQVMEIEFRADALDLSTVDGTVLSGENLTFNMLNQIVLSADKLECSVDEDKLTALTLDNAEIRLAIIDLTAKAVSVDNAEDTHIVIDEFKFSINESSDMPTVLTIVKFEYDDVDDRVDFTASDILLRDDVSHFAIAEFAMSTVDEELLDEEGTIRITRQFTVSEIHLWNEDGENDVLPVADIGIVKFNVFEKGFKLVDLNDLTLYDQIMVYDDTELLFDLVFYHRPTEEGYELYTLKGTEFEYWNDCVVTYTNIDALGNELGYDRTIRTDVTAKDITFGADYYKKREDGVDIHTIDVFVNTDYYDVTYDYVYTPVEGDEDDCEEVRTAGPKTSIRDNLSLITYTDDGVNRILNIHDRGAIVSLPSFISSYFFKENAGSYYVDSIRNRQYETYKDYTLGFVDEQTEEYKRHLRFEGLYENEGTFLDGLNAIFDFTLDYNDSFVFSIDGTLFGDDINNLLKVYGTHNDDDSYVVYGIKVGDNMPVTLDAFVSIEELAKNFYEYTVSAKFSIDELLDEDDEMFKRVFAFAQKFYITRYDDGYAFSIAIHNPLQPIEIQNADTALINLRFEKRKINGDDNYYKINVGLPMVGVEAGTSFTHGNHSVDFGVEGSFMNMYSIATGLYVNVKATESMPTVEDFFGCASRLTDGTLRHHVDEDCDGKCDKCGEDCDVMHSDGDCDGLCDYCGEHLGYINHVDKNFDGKCDKCGNSLCTWHYDDDGDGYCDERGCDAHCYCIDDDEDDKCDICGICLYGCVDNYDADRNEIPDGVCDVCGWCMGDHKDDDHDGICDNGEHCGEHICGDYDHDGWCDFCNVVELYYEHVDELDGEGHEGHDHVCDVCGKEMDYLHVDDKDGEGQEGHDCVCDVCGKALDHIDSNHDGECDVCGKQGLPVVHVDDDDDCICDICSNPVAHTDSDHDCVCDKCGEPIAHIDSDSNCVCDVCGEELDHVDDKDGEGQKGHDCKCDNCGKEIHVDDKDGEGQEGHDCKCDNCGADMGHIDLDHDGICDNCEIDDLPVTHVDGDGDKICDICGNCLHIDFDGNGICDICGECVGYHFDYDGDDICDKCGKANDCDHDIDGRTHRCKYCYAYICVDDKDGEGQKGHDCHCDICGKEIHVDKLDGEGHEGHDCKCDNCEKEIHVDELDGEGHEGHDCHCDNCGIELDHVDHEPSDGYCDICGICLDN